MALFGKKKKAKEKEAEALEEKEGAAAENAGQEGEAAEQEAPKPKPVPSARFSQRAAGIFGRMYKLILSVNLAANVCQVESGTRILFDQEFPLRMRYNEWCDFLAGFLAPEDKERFEAEFSAPELARALSDSEYGKVGVYAAAKEEDLDDPESVVHYLELRADRIPDAAAVQTRCIIYIKELAEKPKAAAAARELSETERQQVVNWNNVRVSSLLSGARPIFFEYNVEEDNMFIRLDGADAPPSEVPRYMAGIVKRSDWHIFHADLGLVQTTLQNAIAGTQQTIDIRYRPEGGKSGRFRVFRLIAAPGDNNRPPAWVVGALTDIDDQVKSDTKKREMTEQISQLVHNTYTRLNELDIEKDQIFRVRMQDGSFTKEDAPQAFSAYINSLVANKVVKPEYVHLFQNLLQKGFLERKTLKGSYDMDVQMKVPGDTEYRWYTETIQKIAGSRYMMFARDISEIQKVRQKEAEMEESSRMAAYNSQMLDTIANLVEFRNLESGPHIAHVRDLTHNMLVSIAELCPEYELEKKDIDLYSEAAVMHDIGKIVVPDRVLNKEGKLTPDEWEIMKRHTTDGARIIDRLSMPGQEDLLTICRDVALHHHERFDGSGYPDGLEGDATAIGVQVIGLADAYDALISERCYKEGMPLETAIEMIMTGQCGAFNPKLLTCFEMLIHKQGVLSKKTNKAVSAAETAEQAAPETEPAAPEAEAETAAPEAETAAPETEPAAPETEPAAPETEPAASETGSPTPEAEPAEQ